MIVISYFVILALSTYESAPLDDDIEKRSSTEQYLKQQLCPLKGLENTEEINEYIDLYEFETVPASERNNVNYSFRDLKNNYTDFWHDICLEPLIEHIF